MMLAFKDVSPMCHLPYTVFFIIIITIFFVLFLFFNLEYICDAGSSIPTGGNELIF